MRAKNTKVDNVEKLVKYILWFLWFSLFVAIIVGLLSLSFFPVFAKESSIRWERAVLDPLPTDYSVLVTLRRTTCGDFHPNKAVSDDAKRWIREPANCNLIK